MSKEFLPSQGQQNVLNCKDKNLIVSASAGTGKTTVMIEKISKAVLNKETTIRDLLVVTFTEAAAFEMKKRLVKKLSASGDEKVISQLSEIDNCAISTLHSFCAKTVRKFFVTADTDPAFKVLAGNEREIAAGNSLSEVFDEYYESGDDDFLQLVEIYGTSRRDDEFKNVIKSLYNFKVCKVDFKNWLSGTLELYEVKNGENEFCNLLNNLIAGKIEKIKNNFYAIANEAFTLESSKLADFAAAQAEKIYVAKTKCFKQNIEEICSFVGFSPLFERILRDNKSVAELKLFARCKALKEEGTKQIKSLQKTYGGSSFEELVRKSVLSAQRIGKLIEVVDKFEQNFEAYKKKNALLDFNDLEHKTLTVLCDKNDREKLKSEFKFVYVDEYQDINEVQESIISLIKGDDNLFLVGDVKQSIYSFRQCDPDIFIKKMADYGANTCKNQLEFLNDNFRSDSEILNFANVVFGHIMDNDFGGVDYKKTSYLVGTQKCKGLLPAVSVDTVFIEKKESEGVEEVYSVHGEEHSSYSAAEAEARQICARIREIVGLVVYENGIEKIVGHSDIVILVRNMTEYSKKLVTELERLGVPLVYTSKKQLFGGTETRVILNLFHVVDNPQQDIPLAGALLGPFGKLDENDLAEIKLFSEGDLWKRVEAFAKANKNELGEKLNNFLAFVEKIRFLSQSMTVSRLLAKIFAETDFSFYTLGLAEGKLRLSKFNEFAASLAGKKYDENIAEFLKFVGDSADMPTEVESMSPYDAVRVMTIHKSKGLEFPIVFVVGCGNSFNLRTDKIVCDKDFGIGAKYFDFSSRNEYATISHDFIVRNAKNRMLQEEMRVLYVAVTRAKNHLFLTGTGTPSKIFSADEGDSFLSWVQFAFQDEQENLQMCRFSTIDAGTLIDSCSQQTKRELRFTTKNEEDFLKTKAERSFEYEHADSCKLELKAVSSKLQPVFKPQEDEEIELSQKMFGDSVTPKNLIGTAYHKLFEMIDFSVSSGSEVEQLLNKLVDEGFVDQATANELSCQVVFDVTKLELFKDLKQKTVYRELPFMLKTKYNSLFDDKVLDEQIFLQGVIDMLIVNGDNAVVIDFKFTKESVWLKSRYEKQLNSYGQAVKQILKVKNVKKYIVSILDSKVIEIV